MSIGIRHSEKIFMVARDPFCEEGELQNDELQVMGLRLFIGTVISYNTCVGRDQF